MIQNIKHRVLYGTYSVYYNLAMYAHKQVSYYTDKLNKYTQKCLELISKMEEEGLE